MLLWQNEVVAAFEAAASTNDLYQRLRRETAKLGFDFCAYGLRLPVPVSNQKTLLFNDYPAIWQDRYQEKGYVRIDPTVVHGMTSILPLLWSDEVFKSQPQFWDEAKACGLRYGWVQACVTPQGVKGMLSLSRHSDPISAAELATIGFRMHWLTQASHVFMTKLAMHPHERESDFALTEREADILRWTADGKTSGEIGLILNISERTVNFHITNSMRKMRASNKTAAVVYAALLGLL